MDIEARDLIEQSPDAMIFADREGIIRAWNQAAERIFGHSATTANGQTLDLIVPERFREQHWTGYDRALAARVTKYVGQSLPTRALRADGTQITVELSFAIVLGADGEAVGALATARDITERFEQERELRRRLRELEAGQPATGA
ncbi:MAG: PAS domain S-box protein [Dehalococcoidia bacterium]